MIFRRNWFIYLSLFLYMAATVLILIFGVTQIKEQLTYKYLSQVLLILGFFGVLALMHLVFYIITRSLVLGLFSPLKKAAKWLEIALVVAVLGVGLALRIYIIHGYPVKMESDYKLYYDVATMMVKGTLLTEANNEYLALFPNCYGYSYILSMVMRIFGTTPVVCLYFNAFASILTALFCYGIGKKLSGSICGLAALIFSCFWPSQIIFSNINGTEASFTCILFGTAFLTVYIMKKYDGTGKNSLAPIILHLLIGVLLALASTLRPMSIVFLIATVLCLLFVNSKLKYKSITDLPLGTIFLSKGWMRVVMVIIGYMLSTQVFNAGIANGIQKDIAKSGALGYSLMVGVNIESDGGYSEKTMKILYDAYAETQSPDAAQDVCMKIAKDVIRTNPMGILELFAKKFYIVWANDDYATTTNIVTMNNQSMLTPVDDATMKKYAVWNNIYYLFMVFLSAVGGSYLLKKDNNGNIFAVFFVGAVVLHILVEIQNRYHYYLLQNFSVLAAVGVALVFEEYYHRTKNIEANIGLPLEDNTDSDNETVEAPQDEPEEEKAKDNNLNSIDVLKAIQDGHIVVTATKAYQDDAEMQEKKGTDHE